jgi:hypothetical protein
MVARCRAGRGRALRRAGFSHQPNHFRSDGPPKDGIPALTNPTFLSPSEVGYVRDDETVMGLMINGEPRAYPHNIGWWNEIVNDSEGDKSFAVSLCPLMGTGQVFNATDVDGSQIEFGVSGLLINSNLVTYDRRDGTTLYLQMIFTAIRSQWLRGPRRCGSGCMRIPL